MKKLLIAALTASLVLGMAGAALAFSLDVNGDFRLQGRSINDKISGGDADYDHSWFQFRTRLNFNGTIDDKTGFYARFSSRNNFGGDNTSTTELDQYGVKIKADKFDLNLGRQAVILGQGSIISTGSDAAGVDNKFDGLVASTKAGDFAINIISGKTNNVFGNHEESCESWES